MEELLSGFRVSQGSFAEADDFADEGRDVRFAAYNQDEREILGEFLQQGGEGAARLSVQSDEGVVNHQHLRAGEKHSCRLQTSEFSA